ncbi:ATP-binding protein [Micromonospora sp. M12]
MTRLPGRLPAPIESAAYFAVAEALSNAVKHAQAQQIRITVEFAPHRGGAAGELTMLVSDDGRGVLRSIPARACVASSVAWRPSTAR